MRRAGVPHAVLALGTTAAGLVALLSYRTPGVATVAPAPAPAVSSAPSSGTSGTSASRTLTGSAVDTRWGPVQVAVVLTDGKITDITVLQQPDGNGRDREINSVALPELKKEALAAQSAQIDTVSGATYTSDGYVQSLQSALDQR